MKLIINIGQTAVSEPNCECVEHMKGKEGVEQCPKCGYYIFSASKEYHKVFCSMENDK